MWLSFPLACFFSEQDLLWNRTASPSPLDSFPSVPLRCGKNCPSCYYKGAGTPYCLQKHTPPLVSNAVTTCCDVAWPLLVLIFLGRTSTPLPLVDNRAPPYVCVQAARQWQTVHTWDWVVVGPGSWALSTKQQDSSRPACLPSCPCFLELQLVQWPEGVLLHLRVSPVICSLLSN